MSSSCQSSAVPADRHAKIHPSFSNLYRWAESDAQFVRSLAAAAAADSRSSIDNINPRRSLPNAPPVVDSYSCRQKFLRSYTFSKKETVPQKTAKCFGKVKDTAADLPCIRRRRIRSRDNSFRFSLLGHGEPADRMTTKTGSKGRKVRGRSLFLRIFHRLISCISSFDVADGDAVVHAF